MPDNSSFTGSAEPVAYRWKYEGDTSWALSKTRPDQPVFSCKVICEPLGILDIAQAQPEPRKDLLPLTFSYKNHRGEVATRVVTPIFVRFGSTEWHPELQWLLRAFDHEKQAEREFAMKDIGSAAYTPTNRDALEAALRECSKQLEENTATMDMARARIEALEAALREIAAPSKRKGPPDFQYWWDVANDRREIARAALAPPKPAS